MISGPISSTCSGPSFESMLHLIRSDQVSAQLLRFVCVGAVNAFVSFTIFAVLIVVGLSNSLALLAATILGVLFNFQTIGRYVFRRRDARLIGRFFAVYAT